MKLSITGQGLLDPLKLRAFVPGQFASIRAAVARGFDAGGRETVADIRNAMAAAGFRNGGGKLAKSIRHKVFSQKPYELPALYIGTKVPWSGAHERGAMVSAHGGMMLIPMVNITGNGPRMGEAKFRRVLAFLRSKGEGFFKEVGGKLYLFAEYQPEYGAGLARFTRAAGMKRGRALAGVSVPIALAVRNVKLQPRLGIATNTRRRLSSIVGHVQRELDARDGGLFQRRIV